MADAAHCYEHPCRFPENAPGPFYSLCGTYVGGTWGSSCLGCGVPEVAAPELMAPLGAGNWNTYFVRQPETQEEVKHACDAVRLCCVSALRYGGTDAAIIRRLGNTPEYSDYVIVRGKPVFAGRPRRRRWWTMPLLWLQSWLPK